MLNAPEIICGVYQNEIFSASSSFKSDKVKDYVFKKTDNQQYS